MLSIHVMPNSLVVIVDEGTHIIAATDPRYAMILGTGVDEARLKAVLLPQNSLLDEPRHVGLELVNNEVKRIQNALEYKDDEDERIEVKPKENKILIDKQEMPDGLKKAFLDLKRRHKPRSHLLKFWDKLQKNPNQNSIQMLYKFLEHNGHPIMADGTFIAYKAVRMDLKDHHTGTNEHRKGKVIRMERDKVDSDPTQTCSHGLHICSWDYLKEFHPDSSRLFEVLVDPKDVVAVPNDYNGTKCRCAAYKVYREVTKQREEVKRKR